MSLARQPRWRALLLVLVACACRGARPSSQPSVDVVIPLHPYFRDLRSVRAQVGMDTLTLLLDTGGGATLITPTVAQRLGCRPYGRDQGFRMTGEPVEFQRCDSLTIDLGRWSRTLAPIAVFDVNALLPAQLPRLDGVLALDAFRGQVLTLDWPGERVVVHAASTMEATLRAVGQPFRAATGESGRQLTAFLQVAGRRGPLWLLLDSGNLQGTLVDSRVFRDSLLLVTPDSFVDLGPGRLHRLPVHSATLIFDGVLGTDFLQGGRLALDLRRTPP